MDDTTTYYSDEASKYSKISLQGEGTIFLSFRDLKPLIQRQFPNKPFKNLKGLDYGCGASRSTRYLKSLGITQVDGFDISKDMIQQAKELDPTGNYQLIASGELPVPNDSYDFALMSFVTVAINTRDELSEVFKELGRILKKDGVIFCLTLSEAFWNPHRHWISYEQDYPENYAPKSGQKSRLLIKSINLELTDSYWSEQDLIDCVEATGLFMADIHHTLGKKEDGIEWQDEYHFAPYTIFSFKKK